MTPTLPPCGVLYTYVDMELRDERNQSIVIRLPCVEVIKEPLPAVGSICTAKGKMTIEKKLSPKGLIVDSEPIRLTRELTCSGKNYVFGL